MPPSSRSSVSSINDELCKNVETLSGMLSKMESFVKDVQDNTESLASFEAKLQSLSENVKVISSIVKDEPGKKSLVTRVAVLEQIIESIQGDFREKIEITNGKLEQLYNTIKLVCDDLKADEMGDKSTIIRLTNVESNIAEIKKYIERMNEKIDGSNINNKIYGREKTLALLKIIAVSLPGLVALVLQFLD